MNDELDEILDELLYNLTTKKPNVVAQAKAKIQELITQAREQAYFDSIRAIEKKMAELESKDE